MVNFLFGTSDKSVSLGVLEYENQQSLTLQCFQVRCSTELMVWSWSLQPLQDVRHALGSTRVLSPLAPV